LQGKSCLNFWLLTGFLAIFVAGCQQQLNYPVPVAKAISPTHISAGQPTFTLTVTGSDFTPSSVVEWNVGASTQPLSTLFVSTTTLTAQVPAIDIQNAGQAKVLVFTPQPGGGTSPQASQPPLVLTIDAVSNPIPQITSVSPSGVFAGSASFVLTLTGSNFASLAVVTVNGNPRSTGFTNSTTLTAAILASDIAQAGTLQIAVINPQPNGGASDNFPFTVKNQTPTVTSLTPVAFTAGSAGGVLAVTGTGYVSTSVVYINGAPQTTAFGSSTQLQVSLTAGDVAAAGINSVEVVNPPPGGGTSTAVTFAVDPTPLAGLPVLLDLAPDGTQANNGVCGPTCSGVPTLTTAGPSVNGNGQFVAFASDSTNLVLNQMTGVSNIFVRNTCLVTSTTSSSSSSAACSPKTLKISQTPSGTDANGPSSEPTIDSGGAHVAYTSTASNLVNYVAVSGTHQQVYWQQTCAATSGTAGCTGTSASAVLVSISADGLSEGNGDSYNPVISADGQYVAFVSLATNLVSNVTVDGVTPQVYVSNTCSAVPPVASGSCTPTTYLVSTLDGTTPANASNSDPAIANTGLFVAFVSNATNLLAGQNGLNGTSQVFVRSTCVTTISATGNTCVPATSLASTPDGVTPADAASIEPAISSDGRFVAFASAGTNLIVGVGPTQEIYVRDTCTGQLTVPACSPSTQLISTPDGMTAANSLSENPSINATCTTTTTTTTNACVSGQYIAFASLASNLGANVENGVENIFTRDTCNGITIVSTSTTLCAPYTFLATQPGGTSPAPANGASIAPSISGDGQTVGFISSATNLVAHDTNALPDFFLAGADLIFDLTVTLQGTGSGTVTDSTGQISCVQTAATSTTPLTESGTCSARYVSGTTVTLTASAESSYTFTGWGGTAPSVTNASCSVTSGSTTTGTCAFGEIANNTATATFK